MENSSGHAIVYGASGLIGWAVVNQLLSSYPEPGAFSKVTAVTNRPLNPSETFWPEQQPGRPELQLVSGVDLRDGDGSTLAKSLKEVVQDIESVTHIYYLVFNAVGGDDIKEVATNLRMFSNVVDAHTQLSSKLKFVVFPGGTRGYGIYVPGGTFTPPLTEEMVNNLPQDYAKTVVYNSYRELLSQASREKQWTWCEVCPDAIIGFTPNGSQFSLALHWAQYLSLYARNHGLGPSATNIAPDAVEVPFPGNSASATSLFTPVAASTIARFMIYASLHPKTCGDGRLFNIADSETPCKYGEIWPQLAKWFGLVGTGPVDSSEAENNTLKVGEVSQTSSVLTPGEYVAKYKDIFAKSGLEKAASGGVGAGSRQLDSVGYWLTFDRQMSIKRIRETGFEGDSDPILGWLESFEMFRKAGLIF
ncbi:hypothetical protein E8E14_011657 [Neopestalotiopsis sp. 37M]|nr:hypothetical protein E8E14_011657 [Neopestalotiopsis sp. 37M]